MLEQRPSRYLLATAFLAEGNESRVIRDTIAEFLSGLPVDA